MTAITNGAATEVGRHAGAPVSGAGRVSFPHVMKSEWIKFFTLRSTYWTLGLTVVGMVLFALMMASGASFIAESSEGADLSGFGVTVATFGYLAGQITVAVLGALIITGEYTTGMIRSTMTAVPKRLPALFAKGVVLAIVTFVTASVGVFASYLVTLPILSQYDMQADLGDSETWRVFLGAGLYVMAIALLAFGIGALLRNSAGAIAAVLGIVLLIPIVVSIASMNLEWVANLAPYLPSAAGERIMAIDGGMSAIEGEPPGGEPPLTPWQGIGLLGAYVAAIFAAACVLLRRRDV
ncbi:putative integral membrane transport protein [Beutenbergia cavernae DSM 12333]|uniref:Putative integral membrane transport protein n=1 Tax=Beutenbergia cavernae (strain ATCC BAA-8 / DSM 12333 / CCUG 43141 / JCM 11478 / NBRC 16432 / NCIMB 13614 / HKI 0122) TaxID=471853 RepID=C5C0C6_BEUC1|nr:ABC transporter permease subunit [Beutenbergia cavernae]ACQ79312.1 putative integral membrane transport protein [Beutenbergia cavernae DSM 12333]